jgi:ATP-dependent helicase/DNAse subunit B
MQSLKRFWQLVEIIVTGIENGVFPANPGGENNPNCQYCDYQAICPADVDIAWQRKSANLEIKTYLSMAGAAVDQGEEE